MCIIRAYHYSTDCFLLKFNYSIALSDSHRLDLRPMGDIVLNPSLRKSKHYLRHRTHMQFVPFDVRDTE